MTKRGLTTPQQMFKDRAGRRLAILRTNRGISQTELGRIVGQHRNTVLRWEKGIFGIDLWSMVLIAYAFEVTPAQLLDLLMSPKLPITKPANNERDNRLSRKEASELRKGTNAENRTHSNFAVQQL